MSKGSLGKFVVLIVFLVQAVIGILGGTTLLVLVVALWIWQVAAFIFFRQFVDLMLEPVERVLEKEREYFACVGDEDRRKRIERHLRKVKLVHTYYLFPLWWEYRAYLRLHPELHFARRWLHKGGILWFSVIVMICAFTFFVGYAIYKFGL